MSNASNYSGSTGPSLWVTLGALLGVLLILAGLALVYYSEGKALSTAASLEQGAALARTVQPDGIDPANEGQLVCVTGEAATNDELVDPDLGMSIKALRLAREVEVFQWKEDKTETRRDGQTNVTYKYTQVWSKDRPARNFNEPKGHTNPAAKPYADVTLNAANVKVGAFALTPKQIERLPADEGWPVPAAMLARLPEALRERAAVEPDGTLFIGTQAGERAAAPEIGAARIRYKVARPQAVTVMARQTNGALEPYHAEAGEPIDLIKPGAHSAQAMFESAHSRSRFTMWAMRGLGLLLTAGGLILIIRRQVAVATGEPPEGFVARGLVALLAIGLGAGLIVMVVGGRLVQFDFTTGASLLAGGGLLALVFLLAARRAAA